MVYTTSLHAVGRDGGNTSFTTGLCTDQLYPGQSVCVCVLMICLAIYRLCLQSSKKRRKEAKAKEELPLQGRSGHSASPPSLLSYHHSLLSVPLTYSLYIQTTVRHEIQLIPKLIFAMEQFEKFLIQLSKKSKVLYHFLCFICSLLCVLYR